MTDEIREVEKNKPIALILTKTDLLSTGNSSGIPLNNLMKVEELRQIKSKLSCQMVLETSMFKQRDSSDDWNIENALDHCLYNAYRFKSQSRRGPSEELEV